MRPATKLIRVEPLRFENDSLVIIDQTLLPGESRFLWLTSIEEVWEAIKLLRVRGAPAIGGAAAYGLWLGIRDFSTTASKGAFEAALLAARDYLASARPTAVNLFWALDRVVTVARSSNGSITDIKELMLEEAHAIKREDGAMCRAIGEHGLTLLGDVSSVLTHCNAGALATMGIGTALAPIYLAAEQGRRIHVFANETRPLLQGARLTAWELHSAGLPVTLITDNMSATVMRQGKVQAVIVGADRVAANGDTANKIGTYGVAILAKEHGIPFYVAAPSSTIDQGTLHGEAIKIEIRDASEVRGYGGKNTAPADVDVYNPAFDVTPAKYITAFITEKGAIFPPFVENLGKVFDDD